MRDYFNHGKDLRDALNGVDAGLDHIFAEIYDEKVQSALKKLAKVDKEAAASILKVFDDFIGCMSEFNSALFAECMRRSLAPKIARSGVARKAAGRKKANDPKSKAKSEALDLWKERQAGKHPKLRTVEQFATEVMRRWPVLTSSKVICGWSAKWTKEVQLGKNPAC